jgi:CBS domain-containing protein
MRSKTVADVMNFGGQNPLRTFNENESLSNIVSYFVEDPNASHRVVLISQDGRCAGYLTQSDVVKYLYQNLSSPYLSDLKDKTLREMRWMPRPLDLVTNEDSLRLEPLHSVLFMTINLFSLCFGRHTIVQRFVAHFAACQR